MTRIAILAGILFILFNPKATFAAEKSTIKPFIRVSPVILNIILSPGKTYQYDIKVGNLLNSPLPLRAALDNFEPSDEDAGGKIETSPLLSWITYDPKDMIIPAGEEKIIHLSVSIPKTVPIGGYYATFFLEPVLPFQEARQTPSVQAKIAVLLLANIGVPGLSHQAEITDFSFEKFIYKKNPLDVTFRVKNLSLYHFSAKPFVTIKPLFGAEKKFEIEEKIVLPGKLRTWKKQLELSDYWHGLYTATLAVSTGNGHQIKRTAYFIGFPFGTGSILVVLLILIVFLGRKRKNLRQFVKTLFSA